MNSLRQSELMCKCAPHHSFGHRRGSRAPFAGSLRISLARLAFGADPADPLRGFWVDGTEDPLRFEERPWYTDLSNHDSRTYVTSRRQVLSKKKLSLRRDRPVLAAERNRRTAWMVGYGGTSGASLMEPMPRSPVRW